MPSPGFTLTEMVKQMPEKILEGMVARTPLDRMGQPLDIANARCITLIGSHLGENMHNTQVQDFADAVDRGAGLVVVDPRFSVAAGKAKYWLPIKPGTDIALLLAWMHVLIEEKRYNREYVDKYALGFDKLSEHVKTKSPEWAYPITGLKPELIRESARFVAGARPGPRRS